MQKKYIKNPIYVLAFITLSAGLAFASPLEIKTGYELWNDSDVIAAINIKAIEPLLINGKCYIRVTSRDHVPYKGDMRASEVIIEDPQNNALDANSKMKTFPDDTWVLYFLKNQEKNQFGFATDPFSQGQFVLSPNLNPRKHDELSSLLVAYFEDILKYERVRRMPIFEGLLPILLSYKSIDLDSVFSEIQDPELRGIVVREKILAGDTSVISEVQEILDNPNVPDGIKSQIAAVLPSIEIYFKRNSSKRLYAE